MGKKKVEIVNPLNLPSVYDKYKFDIVYVQREDQLPEIVEYFRPFSGINIDTETTGLDFIVDNVTLIQLSAETGKSILIDVLEIGPIVWGYIEQIIKGKTLYAINFQFDGKMLKHFHKNRVWKETVDLMLMSQVIYQGQIMQHSLAAITERELDLFVPKDEQTSNWGKRPLSQDQLLYAGMDVEIIHHIRPKLSEKIKAIPDLHNATLIEIKAQKAIINCELTGMPINLSLAKRTVELLQVQLKDLEADIINEFNIPTLNIRSPKQMKMALMTYLKLGSIEDVPTTGKEFLKLYDSDEFPAIKMLLKVSSLKKPLDYIQKLITFSRNIKEYDVVDNSGNVKKEQFATVHTKFFQLSSLTTSAKKDDDGGSVVGRLSSTKPNLQNPDKATWVRRVFEAPPGYFLLDADWSALHPRIYAYISNDTVLLDIFNNNLDPYIETALRILAIKGIDFNTLPSEERKKYRNRFKPVTLGFLFGMGAKRFVDYARTQFGIKYTLEESYELRALFFQLYNGLNEAHKVYAYKGQTTRVSRALGGHRIRHVKDHSKSYNDYLNYPIIGTEAEIFKTAVHLIYNDIIVPSNYEINFCNFVHDEVMLLVPEKYIKHTHIDGMPLYVNWNKLDSTGKVTDKNNKFTIVGEFITYEDGEQALFKSLKPEDYTPVWESDLQDKLADCMKAAFYQYIKNVACKVEGVIAKSWNRLK